MGSTVGVVVRTKDRPTFLARALADIAAQRHEEVRVVVVNDGGGPVADIVEASSLAAGGVVVIDVTGPGGRCAAANQGIRVLDTDLVVLHDDDDLWDPEFLAVTTAWLDAHPEDQAVVTATEIVVEGWDGKAWTAQERVPFWAGMTGISLGEMLSVNRAVPISVVYRRAVHDVVGWYDETLDTVEDWDLYLRILVHGSIGYLGGRPLAYWMQRPKAAGDSANSMFDLADQHLRDDQAVRDRALAEWGRTNGLGLPLYLAGMERRIMGRLDELERRFDPRDALRRVRRRLSRRGRAVPGSDA